MTQAEKTKIPALYELKAIQPIPSSAMQNTLQYDGLDPAIEKHMPFESARQAEFYDAEADSIKEEQKARALARLYMIATAQRLNSSEVHTPESKQLWSDRYTQQSSELYGQPDQELAIATASQRTQDLLARAEAGGVSPKLIDRYRDLSAEFGIDMTQSHEKQDFSDVAREMGEFYENRYADVYEALGFDSTDGLVTVEEFIEAARRGIDVLAKNHDPEWSKFVAELSDDGDKLTTYAIYEWKLAAGKHRKPIKAKNAKGLFTHEILVHGLGGINASRISDELRHGYPGYLDAQEGLGKLAEYAVTGKMPDSADRYIDIALALGMIDGHKRTRQEVAEFAATRKLIKNELEDEADRLPEAVVIKGAHTSVNRIYRGSLGNEFVGVFTKDIAYFNGFVSMANYIQQELGQGKSIVDIMDYLMQGKFDPTNERHVAELERQKHEKQS